MDHYMTQAGLLLLFSAVALSQFLFAREKGRWIWGAGFLLASVALVMTLTRNAWVGVFVVAVVLLSCFKPKALILMPVVVALLFLASPPSIKRRALSIFDPNSYSNAQRIEYLQAGFKIIKDYPLLGTGPNTVHVIFQRPQYDLSEVARDNVHLHNNLLQIAAERGIPTLLVWLAFMTWVFLALLRMVREKKDPLLFIYAAAALSALVGLFAAGFFEYNWGDSEVATLFLGLITLPFAFERSLHTRTEE
jgi:O-antigen ligase